MAALSMAQQKGQAENQAPQNQANALRQNQLQMPTATDSYNQFRIRQSRRFKWV